MAVTPTNADVAGDFERLAQLLEIEGENAFRVRAYRNAAETLAELQRPVAELVAEEADLTQYNHIGREIAQKIAERVQSGRLGALDDVAERVPPELAELMEVRGLGPKGVKALYDHFQLTSLDQLEELVRAGRTRELPGFGAKKEQALLAGIQELRNRAHQRTRLADAEAVGEPLRARLAEVTGVTDVTIAGSYRRRRATVGDLDLLVTCDDGALVMAALVADSAVERVLSQGDTRSTVLLAGGLQVDLRAVAAAEAGAALIYFTGSKAHNLALRQRALDRDLHLNEYGLFAGDERVAGATEEEVYGRLDLAWIPPELREDHGEIDAAAEDALPALVTTATIRGNLHGHTTWSDGRASLEEMAEAARARGYDYLAITDHGPAVRVANGLDADRLRAQAEAIAEVDARYDDLTLLAGCEVDILADGELDLPEAVLASLDVVVCSVHYNLRRSRAEQTERVLRAMDNPYFMIWGHPTAREINRREPIDIDLERCLAAAAERGIAVEINAQPKRLDLSDNNARSALAHGCRLSINTDAHSVGNLDLLRHGVDQARRAGATAADIINTRPVGELRKLLRRP